MECFGFKKSNRLLTRLEFSKTSNQGQKTVSSSVVLIGLQNENQQTEARMGLTVSKKVGKAVERNRIKRVYREQFRYIKGNYPGLDFVVISRVGSSSLSNKELRADFTKSLSRLYKRTQSKK
jgi:ribonuclease P protein component